MTPTPAQIDAAARALVHEYEHPASGDGDLWSKVQALKAALTAAAEAETPSARFNPVSIIGPIEQSATAEVGEPSMTRKSLGWNVGDSITDNFVKKVKAETIERCAQVADEWLDTQTLMLRGGEMTAQEIRTVVAVVGAIAAAIRALKDKP